MSNTMNVNLDLFSIALNQLITSEVFFHKFLQTSLRMGPMIPSIMSLLTTPTSDFAGFISLHGRLSAKPSLWSFKVTNACPCAKGQKSPESLCKMKMTTPLFSTFSVTNFEQNHHFDRLRFGMEDFHECCCNLAC